LLIKLFYILLPGRFRPSGQRVTAYPALLLLAACVAPAGLLNSERIERRYGSYEVRVLEASASGRISSLQSRHDGQAVTRTLAIVSFAADADGSFAREHARIVRGASIGATFKAAGWTVDKPLLYTGTLAVPGSARVVGKLMNLALPQELAVHAYRFDVGKGGVRQAYATIVELHHPDYLTTPDLRRIYGRTSSRADVDTALLEQRILQTLTGLAPGLAP
jgi:hypothetical protein